MILLHGHSLILILVCIQDKKNISLYSHIRSSNLNGAYLKQANGQRSMGEMYGEPTLEGTGIEWYPYKRHQYSMKRTEMKISINSPTVLVG